MVGHPVLRNLATMNNEGFYKMYDAMNDWLEGEDIGLFWGEKMPRWWSARKGWNVSINSTVVGLAGDIRVTSLGAIWSKNDLPSFRVKAIN
jgi:hypothetical protein